MKPVHQAFVGNFRHDASARNWEGYAMKPVHLLSASTPPSTTCGLPLRSYYTMTHQRERFTTDRTACTCGGCLRRVLRFIPFHPAPQEAT